MPGENLELIRETYRRWRRDDVQQIAAALTYYVMLSIAPLLVLLVGVLGRYLGSSAVADLVLERANAVGAPANGVFLNGIIESTQPSTASVAGIVIALTIALWGSMRVFRQLRIAFDRLWNIAPEEPPEGGFWDELKWNVSALGKTNLVSFLMVVAVGATIVASLIASSILAVASRWATDTFDRAAPSLGLIEPLLSVALLSVLFALIYRYLPRTSIAWKDVWVGAGMTAALFVGGRQLLAVYFTVVGPGSAYGAAGAVVALLLWTNLSLQLFLFGAEFTHTWAYERGSRASRDIPT